MYQKVLGHPFVYNRVRPWVVRGVDMSTVYERLETREDDIVVDVGCGTGDALHYLPAFASYHGFDIDPLAIAFARKQAVDRPNATYEARGLAESDLESIQPSLVVLAGLLHHLDDAEATELLGMCARTRSIRRIVTQDVVYLPSEKVSNLLARLDRGKFVRDVEGYLSLVHPAGLTVEKSEIVKSHPESGRARYLVLSLTSGS